MNSENDIIQLHQVVLAIMPSHIRYLNGLVPVKGAGKYLKLLVMWCCGVNRTA